VKSSDVKYIPEGEWITSVSQVGVRKCQMWALNME
jgi:hypothetical protein